MTGHASASASLRYYVVTAVCLLLGTAGLAVPDETAGRLRRHWVGTAIALSLGNTTVVSVDNDLTAVPRLSVENWSTA